MAQKRKEAKINFERMVAGTQAANASAMMTNVEVCHRNDFKNACL
jgi:hypothetical protein